MDFVKIFRDVLVVLILIFIAFRVNEIKSRMGSVWIGGGTVGVQGTSSWGTGYPVNVKIVD